MSDPFVPEADLLEQNAPVTDRDDEGPAPEGHLGEREANEADVLDQTREVPLDDDE